VWADGLGALLSWEPIDFGYRSSLKNEARAKENSAQAEAAVTRLDVAITTVDAYLTLLAAQQVTIAMRSDVERRQTTATSVRDLVQNELRPGADASRADADLAQARIQLIRAQTTERASRAALATLLGLGPNDIQIADGTLLQNTSAAVPKGESSGNPLARAQMSRIADALAREQVLAKSYFPKINLESAVFGRGSGADPAGNPLGGTSGLGLQRANWALGGFPSSNPSCRQPRFSGIG
jgi:outer membrane protein TolC